jgi:GAF domain-containing protein
MSNPLVVGAPRIRFCAGHPLRTPDGHAVGTLCVMDDRPREFSAGDLDALRDLAALAEAEVRATEHRAAVPADALDG